MKLVLSSSCFLLMTPSAGKGPPSLLILTLDLNLKAHVKQVSVIYYLKTAEQNSERKALASEGILTERKEKKRVT